MVQCVATWDLSSTSGSTASDLALGNESQASVLAAYDGWLAAQGGSTRTGQSWNGGGQFVATLSGTEFVHTVTNDAGADCTLGDDEGGSVPTNPKGYGVGGRCYATPQEASAALCISAYPTTVNGGLVSCTGVAAGGALSLQQGSTSTTVAPAYGDCDPSAEVLVMSEMFLLFVVAVAVVWAIKNVALRYVLPH